LGWIEELKQKKMTLPKVDPKEKIERYKKVIELDPKDILGYYTLGDAYLENQKYQEAVETFAKGLEVDPNHSSTYLGLGSAYQAFGQKEKAMDVFRKGIQVAESRGDVMTQRKMESRLRQLSG
jgi:superkiller protein 3